MLPTDDTDALPGQKALRKRIGLLCHGIRLAVVAYEAWTLGLLLYFWSSADLISRGYASWLQRDVSALGPSQQAGGLALHLAIWGLSAYAAYAIWRLFSGYLQGRIFTKDAALWLRRAGVYGLAAVIADILVRPLIAMLVTGHLPAGNRMVGIFTNPGDLLNILFLTGFIALAHVFHVAAEMAEDHSQIV